MPMLAKTPVATELNCELGNYYSYGASDIVNIGFGWSSRDGGDTTGSGGMNTPQAPAQAYKPEELETFKMEIDTRLSTQENLLLQIAQELGLNSKEKKDGKKG